MSDTAVYAPRAFFNATLEPGGQVWHGAGQSPEAFAAYTAAMESGAAPALCMTYVGLNHLAQGRLLKGLRAYAAAHPGLDLIPQIGLSMTTDGSPEKHYEHEVAAGRHDAAIAALCRQLLEWNRPAFLRIGYEFNGHWNGYEPAGYIAAWRRISLALDAAGLLSRVARVWCFAPDGNDKDFARFDPGDDVVDWWAIDLFSDWHFAHASTAAFLDAALARRKPVMIGESTPRYIGVRDGAASWDRWFAPYFGLIRRHPAIKAFCYINWEWSAYPQWSNWGDGRVETQADVLAAYRAEMRLPLYRHAAPTWPSETTALPPG